MVTYLETLVLKNAFDGTFFIIGSNLALKDHSEGSVANDLVLGVLDVASLAGDTVLDLLADDL